MSLIIATATLGCIAPASVVLYMLGNRDPWFLAVLMIVTVLFAGATTALSWLGLRERNSARVKFLYCVVGLVNGSLFGFVAVGLLVSLFRLLVS
jgi:hypothetical protein